MSDPDKRKALAAVFSNPESFATTLFAAAGQAYGTEFTTWDPATLPMQVHDDFGVEMPRPCFNRLNAAIAIAATDTFYRDCDAFIRICNTLWDGRYDPRVFDPADAAEIAWGVTEALLIWPPDETEDEPFSKEVIGYIRKVLQDEGLYNPPGVLQLGAVGGDMGWNEISSQFSDDPTMFQAVTHVQQAKAAEIDEMVQQNMLGLIGQLERIGVAAAAKQLSKAIARE